MYYSKWLLAAGLWSVLTISCAQTQTDTAPHEATETENPKTKVDSKAIESYWTKEKMEKAKPMSTPVNISVIRIEITVTRKGRNCSRPCL